MCLPRTGPASEWRKSRRDGLKTGPTSGGRTAEICWGPRGGKDPPGDKRQTCDGDVHSMLLAAQRYCGASSVGVSPSPRTVQAVSGRGLWEGGLCTSGSVNVTIVIHYS
ncbi:unnamed protein product [Arctogadus glacialis]